MPLSSMTGFARAEGTAGNERWTWEARSVNGKGLDMRLRLANSCEGLEPEVRKRIGARFKRGSVQISLQLSSANAAPALRVNEEALEVVLAQLERLGKRWPQAEPPRLDGLLSLRGILEAQEPDDDVGNREARNAALLAGFEDLLTALEGARRGEGESLTRVLSEQVDRIEALVGDAETHAATQAETLRSRLADQVAALLEASQGQLPEDRLAQEAALLATKADVREELDRLKAHVAAARELLAADGPVGRKFDFLTQEFNREANTLCSKSTDIALTRVGLDLKVVIDQMREQVQNVE